MVIDARRGSDGAGAKPRLPATYVSQSSVFCRKPQERRIRSDISLMSDDELPESNAELLRDLFDPKTKSNGKLKCTRKRKENSLWIPGRLFRRWRWIFIVPWTDGHRNRRWCILPWTNGTRTGTRFRMLRQQLRSFPVFVFIFVCEINIKLELRILRSMHRLSIQ